MKKSNGRTLVIKSQLIDYIYIIQTSTFKNHSSNNGQSKHDSKDIPDFKLNLSLR